MHRSHLVGQLTCTTEDEQLATMPHDGCSATPLHEKVLYMVELVPVTEDIVDIVVSDFVCVVLEMRVVLDRVDVGDTDVAVGTDVV